MPVWIVGLLLAFVQEDTRDLLRLLADDSVEMRERAAAELVKRGVAARKPLEEARAGASEEARRRIDDILSKIDRNERIARAVGKATLVSIDARDRPLREVLEELKRQASTPIETAAVPPEAKVTVAFAKVPFWEALDRICAASGAVSVSFEDDYVLLKAEKPKALPRRFDGPRAVFFSRLGFDGDPPEPGGETRQAVVEAEVCWEAGAAPILVRSRITDFEDDQGFGLRELRESGAGVQFLSPVGRAVSTTHFGFPPVSSKATRLRRLTLSIEVVYAVGWDDLGFARPFAKGARAVGKEWEAVLGPVEEEFGTLRASLEVSRTGVRRPALDDPFVWIENRDGCRWWGSPSEVDREAGRFGYALELKRFAAVGEDAAEIRVRLPAELHTGRLDLELKDVPLR